MRSVTVVGILLLTVMAGTAQQPTAVDIDQKCTGGADVIGLHGQERPFRSQCKALTVAQAPQESGARSGRSPSPPKPPEPSPTARTTTQAFPLKFTNFGVDCNRLVGNEETVISEIQIDRPASLALADPTFLLRFFDYVRSESRGFCEGHRREGRGGSVPEAFSVTVKECENNACGRTLFAHSLKQNGFRWEVPINNYPAINNAVVAANAKEALRKKVWADLKIEKWAREEELFSNPFVFKDVVVGVQSRFERMLSENEAVFGGRTPIVVTGVPTTMFKGNEVLVLAFRVRGNKKINIPSLFGGGGEVAAPFGEYVGAYKCVQNSCMEIL
jgi:hypothetical protein